MAQEASKDAPKAPVKKVDENRQSTPSGKGEGSKGQQTSGGKGNDGPSSQGRSPENFKNGNGKSNSTKGNGGKGTFTKGKSQSSGQFSDMSAGKGKRPHRARKTNEGNDHLVGRILIQVMVHQCTKLLVLTKIVIM